MAVFHWCRKGHLNSIKQYVNEGGDVNAEEILDANGPPIGISIIQMAAIHGHVDIVRYLLQQRGIRNVNLAFISAAKHNNLDVMRAMVQSWRLDINETDTHRMSPLHYAINLGNTHMVIFLLAYGAKPHGALPLAATRGNIEIAKLLIRNGATVFDLDRLGQNPIKLAIQNDHEEMVEFLLECRRNYLDEQNRDLSKVARRCGMVNLSYYLMNL
jgi:ankyrin repeat protein